MKRGESVSSRPSRLDLLIHELHTHDCSVSNDALSEIISFGAQAVPALENIISTRLAAQNSLDLSRPPHNTDWFAMVHAMYLLAHLRSASSLRIVLDFLSRPQPFIDYWLQDLVDEDLWEILFLLGGGNLPELDEFIRDQNVSPFSRLAGCTALVQIALHFEAKRQAVCDIFKKLLNERQADADFLGLVLSELLDLGDTALKPVMLRTLQDNEVWPGILSVADIEKAYSAGHKRIVPARGLLECYAHFRQCAHFARTTADTAVIIEIKQDVERLN